MRLTRYLAVPILFLSTALSASSQEIPAPNISGTSVQGSQVNRRWLLHNQGPVMVPICQINANRHAPVSPMNSNVVPGIMVSLLGEPLGHVA